MRRSITTGLLGALAVAAAPAHAGERVDFELRFAEQTPAVATKWTLHLRYKAPGDPEAKPSAIRRLSLRPPAGTRINVDTHPGCAASNEQIQLLGDMACPPESRVGSGTLTVMSGFGAPLDPYPTNLSLFSARDGLIEVLKDARLGVVLAIERLKLEDGALTLTPAVVPGGPPDYKVAARDIHWDLTSAGWLTTPPACPASGQWTSTGTFSFDDGSTVTETASTPCRPPPPRSARPLSATSRPAMRLAVSPSTLRSGRRARIRVRVSSRAPACTVGVAVRIGTAALVTDRRGRAATTVRFTRPGRKVARASKPSCRPARSFLRVRAG